MLDVMSSYRSSIDQPDCDAIEMFCGQVPRTMTEKDLRILFEKYGKIYKLNILRDKQTGESKGCCFVTYYTRKSALNAQNALHNHLILPGMHHSIQMKPADIENRNERKIFIGMISKSSNENDIKQLFHSFGTIEECTVLRDLNNRSRGCAFITYQKRQSALNAIKTMHHSCTMNGCSSPINVRLADTPKDKQLRKIQQSTTNSMNENLNPLNYLVFNQLYSTCFNTQQSTNKNSDDLSCGDNNLTNPWSYIFSSKFTNEQQNNLFPLISSLNNEWQTYPSHRTDESILSTSTSSLLYSGDHINNCKDVLSTPTNVIIKPEINSHLWSISTDDDCHLIDNLFSTNTINFNQQQQQQQNNNSSQLILNTDDKQLIGPIGSNLFIYHLPVEFTDHDLAQTFSPFGNILSAKVFIDKLTNRSKCFGFVSYDNIYSAHQAIKQMNGFQIGLKRLKVQLKKTFIS